MTGEEGRGRIFQPHRRKVWMLAYYGPKPDGTWGEIRESARTRDEELARRRLQQRIRKIKNHREGVEIFETPTHRRVRVSQLFENLLADYRLRSIKGLYDAELRLRPEQPGRTKASPLHGSFGNRKAAEVTTRVVRDYMEARKAQGKANATVNREVELLRRAFKLAVENGVIARAPAFPARLPEKNARQDFLEPDQFERVLPHLPSPLDEVARFANATGWRLGMIVGLTWEMVDRSSGEIRLPDSKNDDPVSVPLDEELSDLIARRWQARQFGTPERAELASHVFHRDGRPLFKRVCQKQWRRACRLAGLPDSTKLHGFRRTAARNMIRGGVPQSVAQRVTGHRTDSMFRRYDITSADDKLKALRAARAYVEVRKAERIAEQNVREFRR